MCQGSSIAQREELARNLPEHYFQSDHPLSDDTRGEDGRPLSSISTGSVRSLVDADELVRSEADAMVLAMLKFTRTETDKAHREARAKNRVSLMNTVDARGEHAH